jgi:hypothetical protein
MFPHFGLRRHDDASVAHTRSGLQQPSNTASAPKDPRRRSRSMVIWNQNKRPIGRNDVTTPRRLIYWEVELRLGPIANHVLASFGCTSSR